MSTEKAALKPQKGSETFHGSGHLCKGKGKRHSVGRSSFTAQAFELSVAHSRLHFGAALPSGVHFFSQGRSPIFI